MMRLNFCALQKDTLCFLKTDILRDQYTRQDWLKLMPSEKKLVFELFKAELFKLFRFQKYSRLRLQAIGIVTNGCLSDLVSNLYKNALSFR